MRAYPLRIGMPQLIVAAICIGFGLAFVIANVRSWELEDAQAYWNAALRLRDGQPLYVAVPPDADEMMAYRYAPWFVWAWVPLTYLPKAAVEVGWSAVLVLASGVAIFPLLRHRSVAAVCLVALLGGLLIRTASTGNVHALMIAALVWGVPRRSGPLWIGLAASLKFAPILYALVYLRRGQWMRAALAGLVTVLLLAPALAYDLSSYPADPGESLSLFSNFGLAAGISAALTAMAAAVILSRSSYAWVATSTAILAVLPRLEFYSLTYLLVGTGDTTRGRDAEAGSQR